MSSAALFSPSSSISEQDSVSSSSVSDESKTGTEVVDAWDEPELDPLEPEEDDEDEDG